ncbi:tRNA threonylcarbamoyladenosine dehydratase [Stieleria neptunia]|uniref:tRNA threonylcarbamoyladenosine dehydratase n=1 Tax=Stieleria neptunia TaxID=2527979 RepID=A0A518HR24_9BACT|nr:ThiF family adenylyltransferase [Stieleria neptunia]QDV43267.1 tRNA threonylcarbamoyladenosine dehydratase [Stieleria neptunia]
MPTPTFPPYIAAQDATPLQLPVATEPTSPWSYEEAFARNEGLISKEAQQKLRDCTVAIPGMGGVGGVHLITLARLGVGGFKIADADRFSVANFNRQYGANVNTVDAPKASTMAANALAINPELRLDVLDEFVTPENVDTFLDGVDVLVDGVDFFSIDARRMLFNEARKRGIWAITAGPIGFSTAWLVFDPAGMSFDDYFDIHDNMSKVDKLIAFAVGLAPKATQRAYTDLSKIDLESGSGPSTGFACQLASGVAASETMKIVTGRGRIAAVPVYQQFDAFRLRLASGRLSQGNRGPIQRIKRRFLTSICQRHGVVG